MTAQPARADLPDLRRLLQVLGYSEGDQVVLATNLDGAFRGVVCDGISDAEMKASRLSAGDVWVTVNPMRSISSGRGTAADVLRLAALWADLDFKDSGLGGEQACLDVVDDLSRLLGARPAAIVYSGHGLQPYWPIEGGEDLPTAKALLRAWRAHVERTARAHGGTVDAVFDLPRVMRAPGTWNRKEEPVPVTAVFEDGGTPLTLAAAWDALRLEESAGPHGDIEAAGVGSGVTEAPVASPYEEWPAALRTCPYVGAMLDGWGADRPKAGRHQHMLGQMVRLACAARLGCLADRERAFGLWDAAYQRMVADDSLGSIRAQQTHETAREVWPWAVGKVETFTEAQCREELGNHAHEDQEWGALKTEPLGRRIAGEAQDSFLFVHGIGWHRWDGRRWQRDEGTDTEVRSWVADWVRGEIERSLDRGVSDEAIKALLKYRDDSKRLVEAMTLNPAICCRASDLDSHEHLLNAANGVVDLTTGDISPHDRRLRFSKVAASAEYRPGYTHPDWESALEAVPKDVGDYLQLRFGQSCYGEPPPDDSLAILFGGGANGKSTMLGAVLAALGEFARLIPDSLLMGVDQRERAHDNTALLGVRLAVVEELPDGKRLNSTRLKKIVGTGEIAARFLYRDYFTFKPMHSLILSTNHLPQVVETDHGTWRRLMLVEFPYRYVPGSPTRAEEKRGDQRLRDRLMGPDQQSAVLTWLVEGAVRHHRNGLILPEPPAPVMESTDQWRHTANPVAAYAGECLVEDPDAIIASTDLYQHFQRFADANGYQACNQETFSSRIQSLFPNATKKITRKDPTARKFGFPTADLPAQYRAWFGFRWREADP